MELQTAAGQKPVRNERKRTSLITALPLNVRWHNFTSCFLDTTFGVTMIVAGIAADLIGCNRQRLHRRGNTFMEVLRDLAWDILTQDCKAEGSVHVWIQQWYQVIPSANLFTCASWKRACEPLGWASSVLYSSFIQKSITVSQLEGCHDPLLWRCALGRRGKSLMKEL